MKIIFKSIVKNNTKNTCNNLKDACEPTYEINTKIFQGSISILYPTNNWTKYEIDLQPYQVMYFTTNETIGGMFDTRPVAFISIYVEPTTDPNLNQAHQVAFYDYSKSTKMLERFG